jgi:hypothetical protein
MPAPTGFDVKVTPVVTAGAYTAGDIVGGLLTFRVADGAPSVVMVTGVFVGIKAAVTSTLTLLLFDADPTATTKTDNAALALHADDLAKVIKGIPVATLFDMGTPNGYSVDAINVIARPADGVNLYGLLIDGTGFTLVSTSDIIVRLCGVET